MLAANLRSRRRRPQSHRCARPGQSRRLVQFRADRGRDDRALSAHRRLSGSRTYPRQADDQPSVHRLRQSSADCALYQLLPAGGHVGLLHHPAIPDHGFVMPGYAGYRFPPEVIHQAILLYLRFTLSFRDVEDLLAERGIVVSYETIRRWVNHFGPMIAVHLRMRRAKPHATWHLDEVYLRIEGRMVYLWRAVDAEGEVLDVLVQSKRNKQAALKLMRKLLKKYAFVPERLVTDDLRSYGAAARDLGIEHLHERGRWKNNGAENSHQPTATAGAQDATFQERPLCTEIPFNAFPRLQRPAPSDFSPDAPHASHCGDEHVARGCRGSLKIRVVPSARALRMAT